MTVHALAGAFISQKVGNPFWAFFISFFSHYLLDAIPHGDEFIGQWIHQKNSARRAFLVVSTDFAVLALFILFLVSYAELPKLSFFLAGIIGGILPDIFVNVIKPPGSHLFKWLRPFRKPGIIQRVIPVLIKHDVIHEKIHFIFNKKLSSKIGVIFQLLISIFFIYQILISS